MDSGSRLLQNVVPVFLVFIIAELVIDSRRGTGRYRLGATWSDLATGTVSQVCDVLLKAACLPLYVLVYEHARLFDLVDHPVLHWLCALLGVDLLYYFWHRASHELRVLWAIHAVHHQSEDMNLAVALRQPAFQAPSVVLFFMPLACVGVSPMVVMLSYTINLIYQFFTHTQAVRSLGPLEWLLNTPSHHRVHHGSNPEYLDKNYGGMLIVWDRLFGTFEPERAPVRYGVTVPLASYNPVWANLHELAVLLRESRGRDVRSLARLWLGHPAWATVGTGKGSAAAIPAKYDVARRPLGPYVYCQAVLLFIVINSAFLVVVHAEPRSWLAIACAGSALLWSAAALLGAVEERPWARSFELARLVYLLLTAAVCAWLLHGWASAVLALGLAALALLTPFWLLRR
jgi:alkylglycerol monooxygenase